VTTTRTDPAEVRFENYLNAHDYLFEYEPDLHIDKQPDYMVQRGDDMVVCEVKGFQTLGIWGPMLQSPGHMVTRSMKEVLAPVRSQISAAAVQLKPLAGSGIPLVVVLSNPEKAGVDLSPTMVIAAMYGDLGAQFSSRPDGTTSSEWIADRNGKLTNDHGYVSAVVVARAGDRSAEGVDAFIRGFLEANPAAATEEVLAAVDEASDSFEPPEPYYYCDVFQTASTTCVPLPPSVFDGPNDHRWVAVDGQMVMVEH
jgi:hypothetical protein